MRPHLRPAFYALPPGAWRDHVTLLHLPFTIWHLSYVVLGAAAAPVLHLDRLAWLLLAFFLGVGLAAHALDELHGRPLRSGLSSGRLLGIAAVSMAGALFIGVYASLTVSLWATPFVLFGGLIVLAYNLEWAAADSTPTYGLASHGAPFRRLRHTGRTPNGSTPRRFWSLGLASH